MADTVRPGIYRCRCDSWIALGREGPHVDPAMVRRLLGLSRNQHPRGMQNTGSRHCRHGDVAERALGPSTPSCTRLIRELAAPMTSSRRVAGACNLAAGTLRAGFQPGDHGDQAPAPSYGLSRLSGRTGGEEWADTRCSASLGPPTRHGTDQGRKGHQFHAGAAHRVCATVNCASCCFNRDTTCGGSRKQQMSARGHWPHARPQRTSPTRLSLNRPRRAPG
jgi:hypothetical protein